MGSSGESGIHNYLPAPHGAPGSIGRKYPSLSVGFTAPALCSASEEGDSVRAFVPTKVAARPTTERDHPTRVRFMSSEAACEGCGHIRSRRSIIVQVGAPRGTHLAPGPGRLAPTATIASLPLPRNAVGYRPNAHRTPCASSF